MILFIIRPFLHTGLNLFLGITFALFSFAACFADPAPIIPYSPVENLEHTDIALIDQAEHNIDIAADWAIIRALIRAAQRGVYLDGRRNRRAGTDTALPGIARDPRNPRSIQTAKITLDAPKELPNRWPLAAHRRCGEGI
jgi:phosphatidylserine/phosphatidylglycerophosphate/cardiolipin synthase-like enzyme